MRALWQGLDPRYKKLVVIGLAVFLCGGIALMLSRHKNVVSSRQAAAATSSPSGTSSSNTANPWQVRCSPGTDKAKPVCEAFQRLSVAKTGQRVVEFAVGDPAASTPSTSAAIILPLGLLTENLQLQIDQQPSIHFNISYCTAAGCFASFAFDKNKSAALRNGDLLTITAQTFQKRSVIIKLPLSGLSSAFGKTN